MIILQCIKENSRLRIKFHCFINNENVMYKNVYNNNYNCTFPKEIRRAGEFYKVNDADIRLVTRHNGATMKPFYSIKRSNIIVMTDAEKNELLNPTPNINILNLKIFDAGDCVICLSSPSCIVFIPCAHQCVCSECNNQLQKVKKSCPVCRETIQQAISSV